MQTNSVNARAALGQSIKWPTKMAAVCHSSKILFFVPFHPKQTTAIKMTSMSETLKQIAETPFWACLLTFQQMKIKHQIDCDQQIIAELHCPVGVVSAQIIGTFLTIYWSSMMIVS